MKKTRNGTRLEYEDIQKLENNKQYFYNNIAHMQVCIRGCVLFHIDNCDLIVLTKYKYSGERIIIEGLQGNKRVCSFSAPASSYLLIDLNVI